MILAIFMVAMMPGNNICAQGELYAGGTGTFDDPYQIATPEQFDNIRDNRSAYFQLIADLDFTGFTTKVDTSSWVPIGIIGEEDWALQTNPLTFTGSLDGNHYTIRNLHIANANYQNSLLGACAFATVKNLAMEDCSSTAGNSNNAMVASYTADCTFDQVATINCNVDGTVGWYVGGVVARPWRTVFTNIYAAGGFVKADAAVGGLFGYLEEGSSASFCYSSSAVMATRAVGGLIGGYWGGSIQNCVALGDSVNSAQTSVGRILGEEWDYGTQGNNFALETMTINDTLVTLTGASTNHGENITLDQAKSVSFWLESPGFAIDPEDEPVWAIDPAVSDFPIFSWLVITGIHSQKQEIDNYKAYAVPEGLFIEGLKAGDKIEVFDLSGALIGQYNATSASKTIPVSRSGIYLVKVLSGYQSAALKVLTY